MANLERTMHGAARIDHVGQVVTPAALLVQRRGERAERLRRAKAAGTTIIGDATEATRVAEPA